MTLFSEAVVAAQAWLRQEMGGSPDVAPEAGVVLEAFGRARLPQDAVFVDDIVARFSRAELEGRAVGRYGGTKMFPAVGDLVAKKLATADHDAVRAAIAKTVALGYVFSAGLEEEDSRLPERHPKEIWNVWAPGLNAGLIGADGDARRLGLVGFGKKARLGHVGAYYAQAGAVLRAIQSHPEELVPDPVNAWNYDEFPS